jgi:hypothetical protein
MPLIRVNAIFGAAPRLGPMYLIDAELGRAGAPRAPSLCQPWESVAAASVHAAGGPVWMRLSAMSVITASARLTRVCLLPRPRMMCCQYAKLWWMRLLVYRKAFVRFGSRTAAWAVPDFRQVYAQLRPLRRGLVLWRGVKRDRRRARGCLRVRVWALWASDLETSEPVQVHIYALDHFCTHSQGKRFEFVG